MTKTGSTFLSALMLAGTFAVASVPSSALADKLLTPERTEKVEILGRLTGVGLFCGFHDDAVPLKEVIIEVADKHNMDETTRAKLGFSYHSTRDKAFNSGKQGDYECPKLQQFQAEALLAKLNVVQAF